MVAMKSTSIVEQKWRQCEPTNQ